MTDYYTGYLFDNKFFSDKKDKSTSKKSSNYDYIWERQPIRNDISNRQSLIKSSFLILVGFIFMIGTYLISKNIYLTLGLAFVLEISFVLIFHDGFFSLRNRFVNRKVNPFRHFVFWQIDDKKGDTLFITNYLELRTVAIKGFSIEVIPENVNPSLPYFLLSLIEINNYIPFTYQIIHTKQKRGNFKAYIYFMVFCSTTGRLTGQRVIKLKERLDKYAIRMKSLFPADYHHFCAPILEGEKLMGAIRSSLLQEDFNISSVAIKTSYTNNIKKISVIKAVCVLILILIFNIYFTILSFPMMFFLIFNIAYLASIILIWWRNILFQLSAPKLFRNEKVQIINPFFDVQFYHFKRISNILFAHVNNEKLIGIKMFTVNDVYSPPFCRFDKFYSGVINEQIPFTYTVISTPLSFVEVESRYKDFFERKTRNFILRYLTDDVKEFNWLSKRLGIWESILTLSTTYTVFTRHVTIKSLEKIIEILNYNGTVLAEPFRANFSNYNLIELKKSWIFSAFQCEVLKNNRIWNGGSHLVYITYQGTLLTKMIDIVGELKRAVEVRIAAEFNTPQYLENYIDFGHTINTETLRTEVPAGFTFEQLHSLLITHGTTTDRNLLSMKIVSKLIKNNIPCLIFDFNGNWTKLLSYFNKTKYQNNILYFKLGKTFTLNPFKSELAHSMDNLGFLELMFDAYALALKKDERFMNEFKNTLRTYEFNIDAAKTGIKSEPEYKKNEITEELLKVLTDFSLEDLTFFHVTGEEIFDICQFLITPHTIIIDLSFSQNLPKQIYLAFLILSKLIHYLSYSRHYISKFLILPAIDLVFESRYLEKVVDYGKVNKFFDPLIQNKFGLICLANEIRYIHPNVFNYFENIVSFRTTDSRNITALKSHLNLNELHGTGFFTAKRNETYQDHYLRNMNHNQVIMKRSDIYQPFPVEIEVDDIKHTKMIEYEEIMNHMKKQGYNLEYNEQKIRARVQSIKVKRDLGDYFYYIEELIRFFNDKQGLDKVAGLTKEILKKELLKYIYPKAAQYHSKDKEKIKHIRDEIFKILVEHRYLIENHPRTADGSQSMKTCYRIGPIYKKVLEEYYEYKSNNPVNIDVHVIQKETESNNLIYPQLKLETETLLKDALKEAFNGKIIRKLFKMNDFNQNKEYQDSLKIAQTFISHFFIDSYRYYYKCQNAITKRDIIELIQLISNISGFPFSTEELLQLLEKSEKISLKREDVEQLSPEIYQLFYNFYLKLNNFLNR